ncbi:actin depolymerizing protein [Amylocystis lapponica]|nr:actin depolymerizing protein [Amylocystis lapponica]
MSAPTGIAVSQELSSAFSDAISSQNIRFLKVAISNESLVPDESLPPSGTLKEDLDKLDSILQDDVPAYVLVRLDDPPTEWLAIYYVPDNAKVRDKMLYAATRTTLTKSLGSAHFTDNIFATSKEDLTAAAYVKHRQHVLAPKPMSAREKEMADVRAAERDAGGGAYQGSRARQNHIGQSVGMTLTQDVENALVELNMGEDFGLIVINIDEHSETLILSSVTSCDVHGLGSALPAAEPAFAFFAWPQNITRPPRRDIVFIYSCPSASPIKHRMLYSSSFLSVFQAAQKALSSSGSPSTLLSRKVQTSTPSELDESFLASELGLNGNSAAGGETASTPLAEPEKKAFAKPRGPARRH